MENPFLFQNWYPKFAEDSIKARIVNLPLNFLEYLLEDGIFLQNNNKAFLKFKNVESVSSDEDWPSPEENHQSQTNLFGELYDTINQIIDTNLDGKCFPKLNSLSPSDASWMNWSNTMECSNADQIVLLLKTSDIISDYLTKLLENSKLEDIYSRSDYPFILVLKKYYNVSVGSEFRCFVRNNMLIGISQRYPNKLYPHLNENESKYITQITNFFLKKIKPKFVIAINYVVDLYIDRNRPWIIDISPLLIDTKFCLFSWDELMNADLDDINKNGPFYRVVNEETSIVFSNKNFDGIPFEFKNKDTNVEEMIEFMKKYTK